MIKFGDKEGTWDEAVAWAKKEGRKNPERYIGALQARHDRVPHGSAKHKRPAGRRTT